MITDEPQTTANRAILVKATKNVLALGLHLIGVSAPERM
ncbi:MAG: DALR anticodon-binding domain-containing protein [Brevinematales bacterium]